MNNKAIFKRVLDASNSHDEELIAKTIDEVFEPDVLMSSGSPTVESLRPGASSTSSRRCDSSAWSRLRGDARHILPCHILPSCSVREL
jgi:hypothetical protein